MIDIIGNNAFRILGIFSNTPIKECIANVNRIKRLSHVGKALEFPMDLNGLLPGLERSEDLANTAYSLLSLPEDKLKNALFWFINASPVDDQALTLLQQGEYDRAISLFETEKTFSSILNRGVLAFILGDEDTAVFNIFTLIHNEEYRVSFAKAVCGPIFDISERELAELFIDELSRVKPLPDLFFLFQKNEVSKRNGDVIGDRIAEQADKELEHILWDYFNVKDELDEIEKSELDGIKKFIDKCAPYLASIRDIKGIDNIQYRHLSTKIAVAALNKIISKVNTATLSFELRQSLRSYSQIDYSYSFSLFDLQAVLGNAYKLVSSLMKLDVELTTKDSLAKQCQSLEKLMDKAGAVTSKTSFELKTEWGIFNDCSTKEDYQHYIEQFPSGYYVKKANALVEKFVKQEKEEQQRLSDQISAATQVQDLLPLKDTCEKCGLTEVLEDKCYTLCSTKKDFRLYLQTFQDKAKYKKEAGRHLRFELFVKKILKTIVDNKGWLIAGAIFVIVLLMLWVAVDVSPLVTFMFLFFIIAYLGFRMLTDDNEPKGCLVVIISLALAGLCYWGKEKVADIKELKRAYQEVIKHPTEDKCKDFLSLYPDSKYKDEVLDIYYGMVERGDIEKIYEFSSEYETYPQGVKAKERVEYLYDSLYQIAEKTATIEGWTAYRDMVPSDMQKDSQAKIDSLFNIGWGTDENAWKTACSMNTLSSYQMYLKQYPKGKHVKQANGKIVDIQVSIIYEGDHGSLPSLYRISAGAGSTSKVTIMNSTNRILTILYSGTSSTRFEIYPYQEKTVVLSNGRYRVAVSIGVENYIGTENLSGGEYSVEYYLRTNSMLK